MSENSLVPVSSDVAKFDQDAMDAVAKTTAYLPRIQLYSGKSGACLKGLIGIGHYGLTRAKDDIDDLTNEIDVVVCAARAKALKLDGENIINEYDQNSDQFKQIAAESEIKDSGCMFGPEFLLWVPSVGEFVTFFMSSKSARRVSKKLFALRGEAATLGVEYIEKGKYSWHSPVISQCSETPSVLPETDKLNDEVHKFMNPPKSDVEMAKDEGEGGRER